MSIRIIVVTYNSGEHLETFLDSVDLATGLDLGQDVSVVVSDNGSVDGSLEGLDDRLGLRVLRNEANLGYGTAANRAAAGATEDWLVVANPDVRMTPGVLDELIDVAARWPEGGAFGPGILTPEGLLYPSARLLPSLRRGIGHAALGWVWPSNPWSTAYRNDRGTPTEGPVGWLSGSFMVVRRRAFEAVGGFDEGYFMYFEDVDLCDRLGQHGFASVYVPSATVLHVGGHSTTSDSKAAAFMAKTHHRSAYRYQAVRHPGLKWLPVRAAVGAGLAGRYALSRVVSRVSHTTVPARDLGDDSTPGSA